MLRCSVPKGAAVAVACAVTALSVLTTASDALGVASFTGFDPAWGTPVAISDDGQAVLLNNDSGPGLWRAGLGHGPLPGNPPAGTQGRAMSGRGAVFALIDSVSDVIPTTGDDPPVKQHGWIHSHRPGETTRLGELGPDSGMGYRVFLSALSRDGRVAVGAFLGTLPSPFIGQPATERQFRWSVADGVQWLDPLPGHSLSTATAISADGAVAVGTSRKGHIFLDDAWRAVRWLPDGTVQMLTDQESDGLDVSADGQTILLTLDTSLEQSTADLRLWTEDAGLTLLPSAADEMYIVGKTGLSGDGRTIFATLSATHPLSLLLLGLEEESQVFGSAHHPAIWTADGGWQTVADLLMNAGVDALDGWHLTAVVDVSHDGRTLVGYGYNPAGEQAGWVVTIPEPGAMWLLAVGAPAWTRRRASWCMGGRAPAAIRRGEPL